MRIMTIWIDCSSHSIRRQTPPLDQQNARRTRKSHSFSGRTPSLAALQPPRAPFFCLSAGEWVGDPPNPPLPTRPPLPPPPQALSPRLAPPPLPRFHGL